MSPDYLVGGYTPPHGSAAGISRIARGAAVAELVARIPSPSFLARHPRLPIVYAVAEHVGELVVLEERDGALAVVQDGIRAGAAACHVRVSDDGGSAVVACWGDGTVVRYDLDDRGRVAARRSGAPAAAGRVARAHASIPFGDGFVTTDLGLDLLVVWHDDGRRLEAVGELRLPEGTGPRHLVAHPSGRIFVVGELSGEILEIATTDGGLELAGRAPARRDPWAPGDAAAEIALDPTGGWLTVGVRGSDVVAVSRVDPDGGTEPVGEAPSGGHWPRHHVHDDAGVLVANERSSSVVRLPFDSRTGALGPPGARIAVPSPTFLLAVPPRDQSPANASATHRA